MKLLFISWKHEGWDGANNVREKCTFGSEGGKGTMVREFTVRFYLIRCHTQFTVQLIIPKTPFGTSRDEQEHYGRDSCKVSGCR